MKTDKKKQTNNIPDCTIFFLAKAYQKGHSLIQKRLRPYGLTNMQHLVLEGLWYEEGQTASDLGRLLVLDKATLSGILDRMSEGGWIEKKQDNCDRRVYRLHPSQKAKEFQLSLIKERQLANEELLAGFSVEEKILLKRMLWDLI
ncbi:MarR family transcriptional regulator [Desulfobacterales bacterium HSG16]|nr:MarR family transcriptional regulator [Desulfobacterales bacterium HSG16]